MVSPANHHCSSFNLEFEGWRMHHAKMTSCSGKINKQMMHDHDEPGL
jgi:hypothetical protein